ncbi:MAG: hypothetical protein J6S85_06075 [Methanobrevibacter sp.]|nr:hypothetical protein [Methanobrevibacter sp.]
MDEIITLIINNGSAVALLIYFIYKDNKFTDNITKALTSIQDSLEIIKENTVKTSTAKKDVKKPQ